MPIPLLKALTQAGFGSRRRMADAVREGRVRVNGVVATAFNQPVNSARDRLSLDGREAETAPEAAMYLMLHKPPGLLSVTADDRGRPTVSDIIPPRFRRPGLHPVGRLDKDSTGAATGAGAQAGGRPDQPRCLPKGEITGRSAGICGNHSRGPEAPAPAHVRRARLQGSGAETGAQRQSPSGDAARGQGQGVERRRSQGA